MKNLIVLFFATIFCTCMNFNGYTQLSKTETKAWKKKLKKLTPEQYKRLTDENNTLKGQISGVTGDLDKANSKIVEKDEQIVNYQAQVGELRQALAKINKAAPAKNVSPSSSPSRVADDDKGIVFKVQIGAFTRKDLSRYLDNARNFSGEEESGVRKYTIGVFRDYWEADTFKKYLREMGVKDAWVVSYSDGNRVPIKDVLEGVSSSSNY